VPNSLVALLADGAHRLHRGLQILRGSTRPCFAENVADRRGRNDAIVGVDVDLARAIFDAR
jgi:hypothetical protein